MLIFILLKRLLTYFPLKEKFEAAHPPQTAQSKSSEEVNLSDLINKFREQKKIREEKEKEREERERRQMEIEREFERTREEKKKKLLSDLRSKLEDKSIYNLDYLFPAA